MQISFAPESKLIIDFTLEPRKKFSEYGLIEVTDKHLSYSKILFTTDGLKFYAVALLKKYGEWIDFPKTGHRRRPKKPVLVPDKDLKYVQVIKNRHGKKLQKIYIRIIFDQNIDQKGLYKYS